MIAVASGTGEAAPFTWSTGTSALTDGSGNWNATGGTNWFNGSTYGQWGNTSADTATFGVSNGVSGTITVGNVTANGITFNNAGSGNYRLSSGTITLAGTSPTITVNASGTTELTSVLAGSAGLTKTGSGTLRLSINNTYTGTTTILQGAVRVIGASNSLGAGTNGSVLLDGGGIENGVTSGFNPAWVITVGANGGTLVNASGTNASTWTLANSLRGSGTLTLRPDSAGFSMAATQSNFSGKWVVDGAGGGQNIQGIQNSWGTATGDDVLTLVNGATILAATGTVGSANQGITVGPVGSGSNRIAINGGAVVVVAAKLSGTSPGSLVFRPNGTLGQLTISNTQNSYAADTVINAGAATGTGAWFMLGASQVIPDGAGKGNVFIFNGNSRSALDLNGFSETINGLSSFDGSTLFTDSLVDNRAASTSATLTLGGNNASATFGGVIQNTGSSATLALTKIGSGTQTLSGANTYAGSTNIIAGTLRIGAGSTTGALSTSSAISGSAGATLAFERSDTVTQGTNFASVIGGAVNLSQLGSGTLVLNGVNTFSGTTRAVAGTLSLNGANALQNSTLDLNADDAGSMLFGLTGTNTYNIGGLIGSRNLATSGSVVLSVGGNGASGTYSGTISGGGAFTKVGAGTLTLSAANTYTGTTTVNAGILALGTNGVISNQSNLLVNGGGFNLAGFSDTVGTVTLTSGSIFGSGTLTGSSYVLGGGTVTANLGSGTVTVTAASTLAGTSDATALNLNSGTLTLGSGSRFTSSAIAVTGSSGSGLTLSGNETFGSLAGAANIALGANTLSVGGADTSTPYSGIISGAGGLTKTGNGALTLSAANTYTGATTISSGTIIASVANAISGSSAITLGSAGSRGFLKIDDALTISSLTFTGSGGDVVNPSNGLATFSAASGTATITVLSGSNVFHANATLASPTLLNVASNAIFTFHNNISGSATFTKQGAGTLNIIGDNDGYSGSFLIAGGRVNIGSGMNQIGSGTTTLSNGSTLDLGGQAFTDRIVVLSGTILNAGGTATTTTIAGLSTIGGTTAQGTYNITSTGSALFNVAVGDGASAVNVNVNSAGGSGGQASFAQAVGANGNITVWGGGTAAFGGTVAGYVTTHGASTFNGNVLSGAEVQVNSGTAGTGSALFAAGVASTVTVQSGAAAEFRGAVSGPATVSGSALFTSASSLTGSLATNAGGVVTFDNVNAAITGSIRADGLVTVNRASGSQTISGVISGAGSFVKQGAGLVELAGSNTFSGATTIAGGTLSIGNGGISGALAGNVVNNAALIFNRSDNTTFAGDISGSGGLEKLGAGKLTLTGSNSYLGTTTVSSGTLAINGQIAGSAAVTGGATIGGSGVIGGVLSGAGLVSPGNSPGILTASQFDPSTGLDAAFELTSLSPVYNAPTASVNDILRLTSGTPFTTALGGGNVIDFYFNMNSVGEGTYEAGFFTTLSAADLFTALQSATVNYWIKDSSGGQVFNGGKYSPYSGLTLSTATVTRDFGAGNVTGSVTQFIIVPEPTSLVLACGGIAVAAWAARRRRS